MSRESTLRFALLLSALCVAFAAAWWLFGTREPSADARALGSNSPSERAVVREVASLRAEIREERAKREELAAEIEAIWAAVETGRNIPPAPSQATGAAERSLAEVAPAADKNAATPAPLPNTGWFNSDGLVASGFKQERTAWLREQFEELQIEELYLRDQADREGWARTPRFHREINDLRAEIRQEIGDDAYDALLFGAGRPNRVLASDVLRSSPAHEAGVQPGDVLLRYDGHAIFSGRDLRTATVAGKAGASVPVDVLRNGETRRFYISRGPLGLRLRPVRQAPEPAG